MTAPLSGSSTTRRRGLAWQRVKATQRAGPCCASAPAPVTRLRNAERQCWQCKLATSPPPGSRCDRVLACSPVWSGFAHPAGGQAPVPVGENLTGCLHHPIGKGAWPRRSVQGMVGRRGCLHVLGCWGEKSRKWWVRVKKRAKSALFWGKIYIVVSGVSPYKSTSPEQRKCLLHKHQ